MIIIVLLMFAFFFQISEICLPKRFSNGFLNEIKAFFCFTALIICCLCCQMKERAIQTVGFLPVGDGEFPHQKKILQGLMDSVEVMLRRSS